MRLWWLLLLGLAACSPYSFPKEVGAISTGVDQLASGFTAGYSALAQDRSAEIERHLIARRATVAMADSCLGPPTPGALPCELYDASAPQPPFASIVQQYDKTMAALAVLKDYAHALAAVTSAADRTAYDAAVAQLAGSVGALAKNAEAAAPGAGTVAPPVVSFIGWVVGTALDQQRFDSLKAAVNAVGNPPGGTSPIGTVSKTLGSGLVALSLARQATVLAHAQELQGQLKPTLADAAYRQGLSDTQAVVAVLDGLRQADPTAAARALTGAHDALVAAVNDPGRNYPGLLQAVVDFTNRTTALQAALAATATPEKAKKGS